jgi:DNA-binding NarL/FixJ family response regulator
MAIRVVVADDQTLIREALSAVLREQADMEVVGQAADGDAVMELTAHLQPDVIVMDVSMPPVLSGLEATRWICATWPRVKVIALSMYGAPPYVAAMLKAGARGYLLKDVSLDDLPAAVRAVAEGKTYVSPALDISLVTSQKHRPSLVHGIEVANYT